MDFLYQKMTQMMAEIVSEDDKDDATVNKGVTLFKVADKTKKLLTTSFSAATPYATRWYPQQSIYCPQQTLMLDSQANHFNSGRGSQRPGEPEVGHRSGRACCAFSQMPQHML